LTIFLLDILVECLLDMSIKLLLLTKLIVAG